MYQMVGPASQWEIYFFYSIFVGTVVSQDLYNEKAGIAAVVFKG